MEKRQNVETKSAFMPKIIEFDHMARYQCIHIFESI